MKMSCATARKSHVGIHLPVYFANGTAVGNMSSNQCQVPPSRQTWEMLIATCTESADLPMATECMMQMEAAGMKPSSAVVTAVMNVYADYERQKEDKQRKVREEKEKQRKAQRKHSYSVDLG